MIKCTNLTKEYMIGTQRIIALDNVNVEINKGEFVAIVGESGSGKSTLLNMIGLIDTPSSGNIQLCGTMTHTMSETDKARYRNQYIGYIFQSFFLEPGYSVAYNVELPLLIGNVPRKERKLRCEEAIERVGLQDRAHNKASELSGGEKQRACIARALINKPEIILADEPCGNLDSRNTQEILGLFEQLNKQGITILLITHSNEDSMRAGRRIRMMDGRIISE